MTLAEYRQKRRIHLQRIHETRKYGLRIMDHKTLRFMVENDQLVLAGAREAYYRPETFASFTTKMNDIVSQKLLAMI